MDATFTNKIDGSDISIYGIEEFFSIKKHILDFNPVEAEVGWGVEIDYRDWGIKDCLLYLSTGWVDIEWEGEKNQETIDEITGKLTYEEDDERVFGTIRIDADDFNKVCELMLGGCTIVNNIEVDFSTKEFKIY